MENIKTTLAAVLPSGAAIRPPTTSTALQSAGRHWQSDEESLRQAEHELACEAAIALRDVTYGRERGEAEKRAEAQAMSLCLEEVPAAEILPLMKTAIQNHDNPFPPKSPDLLRRWRGEEWAQCDGKAERVTMANAGAYAPFNPPRSAAELAWREEQRRARLALTEGGEARVV